MSTDKIRAGKHTFDLSQTVPLAEQKWRSHLALVLFGAEKVLGLITEINAARTGTSFTLFGTLSYEGAQVQRTPQGAKIMSPPLIIPYDTLGPATLRVSSTSYVLLLKDQDLERKASNWDFIYSSYQAVFSPPSLVLPSAEERSKIILT